MIKCILYFIEYTVNDFLCIILNQIFTFLILDQLSRMAVAIGKLFGKHSLKSVYHIFNSVIGYENYYEREMILVLIKLNYF